MSRSVKINLQGINAVMKGEGVQKALQDAGETVAKAAGAGYDASTHQARWIAVTNVYPNSAEAANENHRENTLAKAMYGRVRRI